MTNKELKQWIESHDWCQFVSVWNNKSITIVHPIWWSMSNGEKTTSIFYSLKELRQWAGY